jgi:hypothetical protein
VSARRKHGRYGRAVVAIHHVRHVPHLLALQDAPYERLKGRTVLARFYARRAVDFPPRAYVGPAYEIFVRDAPRRQFRRKVLLYLLDKRMAVTDADDGDEPADARLGENPPDFLVYR